MPTTVGVGILTFMSRKNVTLSGVGDEKSFITSGQSLCLALITMISCDRYNCNEKTAVFDVTFSHINFSDQLEHFMLYLISVSHLHENNGHV